MKQKIDVIDNSRIVNKELVLIVAVDIKIPANDPVIHEKTASMACQYVECKFNDWSF